MTDNQSGSALVLTYAKIKRSFANKYPANDERSAFYKTFLPARSVSRLANKANVKKTLENEQVFATEEIDLLWDYINGNAEKVFLILVYMRLVKHIGQFKASSFTDKDLPVATSGADSTTLESIYGTGSVQLTDLDVELDDFADNQWMFLAPEFRISNFVQDRFDQAKRLPYLEPTVPVMPPPGGFGEVRKVILHEDHCKGKSPYSEEHGRQLIVALKTLRDTPFTDVEKFYTKESSTLQTMADMKHKHLIQAIAAYKRGQDKFFLFPWAQGGNLRDLWRNMQSSPGDDVVAWVLEQMVGIAEGLKKLHKQKIRHGDIKPENILFFPKDENHSQLSGVLVVADVGLAKFHAEYTKDRRERTTTNYRTIFYEPPELTTHPERPVSHRYDLWSLGCVYLEFLIWIRYGYIGLKEFSRDFSEPGDKRFWRLVTKSSAMVHPNVTEWIDRKLKDPAKPDSVISKLADLIARYLLVVETSDRNNDAFVQELKKVRKAYRNGQEDIKLDSARKDAPLSVIQFDDPADTTANRSNQTYELKNRTAKLNDDWKSVTDNELARTILGGLDWESLQPKPEAQKICSSCSGIDFGLTEVQLNREIGQLTQGSSDCSVCDLLSRSILETNYQLSGPLTLFRDDKFHTFRLNRNGPHAISLYSDGASSSEAPPYTQIGLPVLSQVESPDFYNLVRTWIHLCDNSHSCISAKTAHVNGMPTRVLYVGDRNNTTLRLIETDENMDSPYVALSHCWGKPSNDEMSRLKTGSIASFKEDIPYSLLPKSFQDAIRVTRAIGIAYLWIDSLCIVQDDGKDWETEASRMEHVFSSAHCTIAATSATSSSIGFLGERPPRPCITINSSTGPLYLAPFIDRFKADVEEGVLNSRGWVLQERALSRRTIHFTSTQMYWECGNGVHCETLAQLYNPQSQILGDADFPTSGLQYYKDERIRLTQYLYEVYCGLGLTKSIDRSKAIVGLETRLARAFKSPATYGIIWKFFERMLLWRAESPESWSRIAYDKGSPVPTWSWMASTGKIQFMNIPFGVVTWLQSVENPFKDGIPHSAWDGSLVAKANELNINEQELRKRAFFDCHGCSYDSNTWRCVVMGRGVAQSEHSAEIPHYVILIRKKESSGTDQVRYERIGVGVLEKPQFASESVMVHMA